MKVQRLRFSDFLREYRQAEMPDSLPKENISNFLSDTDNLTLLRAHSAVDRVGFIFYRYDLGVSTQRCYLIATHKTNEPVGYMMVQKISNNVWQVLSTEIYDPYTNKGLGTDFYIKVIRSEGIKLVNGESLSKSAERVWTKLNDQLHISILDKQTLRTYSLSDVGQSIDTTTTVKHPKDDKEGVQRFFFIAESVYQYSMIRENIDNDYNALQYELWLQNKSHIPYPRAMSFFGYPGDF